jgi:hypothetical protein
VIEVLERVVVRFVTVVCPPSAQPDGTAGTSRVEDTVREFEQFLAVLAPAARRALRGMLLAIDQGARLYPAARGRRFADLDDRTADAYLRALLARNAMAQRLKGVVVMCYYELAETKRDIGYQPGPYIAEVSRRRLELYGDEIREIASRDDHPGR